MERRTPRLTPLNPAWEPERTAVGGAANGGARLDTGERLLAACAEVQPESLEMVILGACASVIAPAPVEEGRFRAKYPPFLHSSSSSDLVKMAIGSFPLLSSSTTPLHTSL